MQIWNAHSDIYVPNVNRNKDYVQKLAKKAIRRTDRLIKIAKKNGWDGVLVNPEELYFDPIPYNWNKTEVNKIVFRHYEDRGYEISRQKLNKYGWIRYGWNIIFRKGVNT